jgi:hypothetical protein
MTTLFDVLAESIPWNRFLGSINVLAGRYDNSIPIRFLATIDCLKIPACESNSAVMAEGRERSRDDRKQNTLKQPETDMFRPRIKPGLPQ